MLDEFHQDIEIEDKRLRMVHRNPELAKKMFPFKKRLGVEDFLLGTPGM